MHMAEGRLRWVWRAATGCLLLQGAGKRDALGGQDGNSVRLLS